MTQRMNTQHNINQHKDTGKKTQHSCKNLSKICSLVHYSEYNYSKCHCAECRGDFSLYWGLHYKVLSSQ
jgi:hypothetical protein